MTYVWELDTPALIVDLDALEHNASLVAERCGDAGIVWRPHVKACKAPAMALRLIEAGAVGVTCAKASEALAMAQGGVRDIFDRERSCRRAEGGQADRGGQAGEGVRLGRRRAERSRNCSSGR